MMLLDTPTEKMEGGSSMGSSWSKLDKKPRTAFKRQQSYLSDYSDEKKSTFTVRSNKSKKGKQIEPK